MLIARRSGQRYALTLLNQFYGKLSAIMSTAKQEVESLLSKLPDDCSLEDIQYHLYVIEQARNGLEAADSQGTVSQKEVERRLGNGLPSSVVSTSCRRSGSDSTVHFR